MDYNCNYSRLAEPPGIEEQFDSFGRYALAVGITGAITTIILMVLFVLNVFTNIKESPARMRRLLAWITSMPMVVSLLSLIIFLVPKASDTAETVKQVYMPFMLMHFIDLAMLIQGGEEGLLHEMVDVEMPISLCAPPFCCFGLCFRNLTFTKIKLRILKGLIYQAPVIQLVLIIAMTIMEKSELLNKSDPVYQVLSVLNILAFMSGIFGFNVLVKMLRPLLMTKWKRSLLKSKVLSFFIILLKLQNFILGIIYYSKAIPCIEPHVSPETMRQSIDASLTIVEAFFFGILFHLVFKKESGEMLKPPRRPSTIIRHSRSSMSPRSPMSPTSPYSPVMTSTVVNEPLEDGFDIRSPRQQPPAAKFTFDTRKSARISSTEC